MQDASPGKFQRPTLSEVWWVAVQGATDPSGGWIVLADEDQAGVDAIQDTFAKARIPILAAVDTASLSRALGQAGGHQQKEQSIVWVGNAQGYQGRVAPGSSAQALLSTRLEDSCAHIVLSQTQQEVQQLLARLTAVPSSTFMEGVRMDLRSPPRGQGSWGLTLLRAGQVDTSS